MQRFYLVLWWWLFMFPTYGQISGLYPDQFSSFFYNPSLINPAYIPEDGSSETVVQSKLRNGVYKDISTLAATIQKTFISEGQQWHSARLLLMNEKQGPYISTPRVYGNYGTRVEISEKMKLLAGVSLGMVNPNFHTPSKTVSTILPDGSIGLILRYQKTSLGVSSNQIFNSSSATSRSIELKRYYNTYLQTKLSINYETELKMYFLWRYFSDIPSQVTLASSLLYREIIEAGIGYNYKQGGVFYASFILDHASKHPIKLGVLYNSSMFKRFPLMGQSLELNLIYSY